MSLCVLDSLANGRDLLGLLVRDFHFEFVFQGHHQFHGVQRVSAEVVNERGIDFDVCFGNAQLLSDDF